MRTRPLAVLTAAAITTAALLATGCSSSSPTKSSSSDSATKQPTKLVIYTDQHAELVKALTDAYTKETGVTFDIQNDASVGQIQAEGAASPADLFLSEDPNPAALLAREQMTIPVNDTALHQVREGLSAPDGSWVAYAARARVILYNPDLIAPADLPTTLMDVTKPKYKGSFAYAPSGAFQATTQYLISTIGEAKTKAFLQKVKANGVDEQKNGNVRDTVDAGKHAFGLANHYYWYVKAAEVGGADHMTSQIYHFPNEDVGNLVLSSGAAILKTSKHEQAAQDFLTWLTSPDKGQKLIATGPVTISEGQYPVATGMKSDVAGSLDDIKSPAVDMSIFGDQEQAEHLLKSLGMTS